MKKARKAKLLPGGGGRSIVLTKALLARKLFDLARRAQAQGWSAEELLRAETKRQEREFRKKERLRHRL